MTMKRESRSFLPGAGSSMLSNNFTIVSNKMIIQSESHRPSFE
jgi:hypothetical protein